MSAEEKWVTFRELAEPLAKRGNVIASLAIGAAILAGTVTLILPRSFEASAVLATAGGTSFGSLGSLAGAAAAFGGISLGNGGLTPTPELVSALLVSRGVLTTVGTSRVAGGVSLVEALAGRPVPPADVPREMGHVVRVEIDSKTGLVTVIARNGDSALARRVVNLVIDQTTRSFVEAARSQARGVRIAQEERVDSARRQISRAETEYRTFLRSNRSIAEFSLESVDRGRLARDVDVARQVYLQAAMDRESAVAKELQQTPAVVVVDPAPAELPERPRRTGFVSLLAGMAGLLLGVTAAYVAETGSPRGRSTDRTAQA